MQSERILIFPFDLLSHYTRCIELAKRYTGASIVFATSKRYNHLVLNAGYQLINVETFNPDRVMKCAERFNFSWLNEADIERVFLSQVSAIKELKPTLVIGDMAPTLKMAAEYVGVSCTTLMNGYMSPYYQNVRMPPKTHPVYRYLAVLPPMLIQFGEQLSFYMLHAPFRRLRTKYKLSNVGTYLLEFEGDTNLICDDASLFPQKELPDHYKFIGPLIYDAGSEGISILDNIPQGKKIIFVSMGSSGNWAPLRFLSMPQYSNFVVVTAGDTHKIITGSHVLSQPFISLKHILPRVALLICHGGNGTIYQALRYNVPMLCYTSHFEQEWNVQRLEALKLSKRINRHPQKLIDDFLRKLEE